jgi:hypothetical protein
VEIIRDTREKVGYWDFSSCDFCDTMSIGGMKTGDYTVAGLDIERKKSVAEIANNITAAHFIKALERMSTYPHKFIVCEFSIDDILKFPIGSTVPRRLWEKIRVRGDYIMREMCNFQLKYDIHIVYAGDVDNAMTVAGHIFKRTHAKYSR